MPTCASRRPGPLGHLLLPRRWASPAVWVAARPGRTAPAGRAGLFGTAPRGRFLRPGTRARGRLRGLVSRRIRRFPVFSHLCHLTQSASLPCGEILQSIPSGNGRLLEARRLPACSNSQAEAVLRRMLGRYTDHADNSMLTRGQAAALLARGVCARPRLRHRMAGRRPARPRGMRARRRPSGRPLVYAIPGEPQPQKRPEERAATRRPARLSSPGGL